MVRGLTTAGFAGGLWLLGASHAYAHDNGSAAARASLDAVIVAPSVAVDATTGIHAAGTTVRICVHVSVGTGTATARCHPVTAAGAGTARIRARHVAVHLAAASTPVAASTSVVAEATGTAGYGTAADSSDPGPADDGVAAGQAAGDSAFGGDYAPAAGTRSSAGRNARRSGSGTGIASGGGRSGTGGPAAACLGSTTGTALTGLVRPAIAADAPAGNHRAALGWALLTGLGVIGIAAAALRRGRRPHRSRTT